VKGLGWSGNIRGGGCIELDKGFGPAEERDGKRDMVLHGTINTIITYVIL
jgi:hypothetical protein